MAADRAGAQPAGQGVCVDVDPDAVDGGQAFRGEDVLGQTVGDDPARFEQRDPVGDGRSLVEVVQDDADRDSVVVRQVADEVEEFDLVAQVEIGGRLVEQQHTGFLGEATGEPHPLQLTAGQVVGAPLGEVRHTGQRERTVDRGRRVRIGPAEAAPVRVAAELDDVPHGQSAGRGAALGQQGDVARELTGTQGEAVGVAVDPERGVAAPLQPGDRPQERRLAAAVGADQHGHLAGPERDRGVVYDVDAVVRHGHTRGRQFMTAQTRGVGCFFTRSHMAKVSLT
jgi:hypothetical protein